MLGHISVEEHNVGKGMVREQHFVERAVTLFDGRVVKLCVLGINCRPEFGQQFEVLVRGLVN